MKSTSQHPHQGVVTKQIDSQIAKQCAAHQGK